MITRSQALKKIIESSEQESSRYNLASFSQSSYHSMGIPGAVSSHNHQPLPMVGMIPSGHLHPASFSQSQSSSVSIPAAVSSHGLQQDPPLLAIPIVPSSHLLHTSSSTVTDYEISLQDTHNDSASSTLMPEIVVSSISPSLSQPDNPTSLVLVLPSAPLISSISPSLHQPDNSTSSALASASSINEDKEIHDAIPSRQEMVPIKEEMEDVSFHETIGKHGMATTNGIVSNVMQEDIESFVYNNSNDAEEPGMKAVISEAMEDDENGITKKESFDEAKKPSGIDPNIEHHMTVDINGIMEEDMEKEELTFYQEDTEGDSSHSESLLPLDLIKEKIFPFLPLRELYSFSQVNSELKKSVTVDTALKAVMTHSRYSLESAMIMNQLIQHRSIYPVAPDRIMRIGLGRKCEICLERKVQHLRYGHGMFACWRCTRRSTKKFEKVEGSFFAENPTTCTAILRILCPYIYPVCYGWRELDLDEEAESHLLHGQLLLAKAQGIQFRNWPATAPFRLKIADARSYMWKYSQKDNTLTRVGPVVTYELAVSKGMKAVVEQNIEGVSEIISHVQKLLEEVSAPSSDDPMYMDYLDAFNRNFQSAKEDWYLKQAKREMKEECYVNMKIAVAKRMITSLKTAIDDPSKDYLLDFHVDDNYRHKTMRRRINANPLKMNVYWVEEYLKEILRRPSKLRGRLLMETALSMKAKSKEDLTDEDQRRLVVRRYHYHAGNIRMQGVKYAYVKNFATLGKRSVKRRRDARTLFCTRHLFPT